MFQNDLEGPIVGDCVRVDVVWEETLWEAVLWEEVMDVSDLVDWKYGVVIVEQGRTIMVEIQIGVGVFCGNRERKGHHQNQNEE